eukprot:scaffold527_cov33-Prasinocladus_malaysianus.AAC.1
MRYEVDIPIYKVRMGFVISDDCLKTVSTGLKNLLSLDLGYCARIGDAGIESLAQITALTRLDLQHCTGLSSDGLQALSALVRLRSLNLSHGIRVDNSTLEALAGLSNLTCLNLTWLVAIINYKKQKEQINAVYKDKQHRCGASLGLDRALVAFAGQLLPTDGRHWRAFGCLEAPHTPRPLNVPS